jgi:hypothetical protein
VSEVYPIAIISNKRGSFKWGELVDGVKWYSCTEPQLDLLASPCKYTWAFAGSGGGKTCLVGLSIWKHLAAYRKENPNSKEIWRALVVSPTTRTFESSQLKAHIDGVFNNTVYQGTWNDQKGIYTGKDFEIVCRTAENDPKRLTGGQYHYIVVDEAWAIRDPEVWEEIRRRSNIKNAQILGVTTPNVNGWIYSDCYMAWKNGDPDYYVVQWATNLNPEKTPAEHKKFLDAELKKLGQARFDRMYGGQFAALTGLVYDSFSDRSSSRYPVIKPVKVLPSPAVRCFIGLDWGWVDPTAVLVFIECEDKRIYCVEEVYQSNLQIDELGRILKALIAKWTISYGSKYGDILKGGFFESVYCDTSRPESKEIMKRFGVPIHNKKIADIEAGIAITDQVFRTGRLKIWDCCTNLIREATSYEYGENAQPRPRQSDHGLDATRYGISSYFYGKQIDLLDDEPVIEVTEKTEADKAIMLGHISTPDELVRREQAEWEAKQKAWQLQMEVME